MMPTRCRGAPSLLFTALKAGYSRDYVKLCFIRRALKIECISYTHYMNRNILEA